MPKHNGKKTKWGVIGMGFSGLLAVCNGLLLGFHAISYAAYAALASVIHGFAMIALALITLGIYKRMVHALYRPKTGTPHEGDIGQSRLRDPMMGER